MLLDQNEQARAERFRFDKDRGRYIAAHVSLRLSLAERVGQAPEEIEFAIGRHGKPELAADCDWVFNLSHSGNIGLIAVAPRKLYGAIGVDVEMIGAIDDLPSLARDNFTDEEFNALIKSRDGDALRLFLRCWTRKEACLKALGSGFTVAANSFTAGLTSDLAKVRIDVEGQSCSVHVKSLFESETCIAAVSWSRELTDLRPGSAQRVSADSRSTQEGRLVSWT